MPQFIIGCLVGYAVGLFMGIDITNYSAGMTECEADLPRSQTCTLVAVPKESS